MPQLRGRIAQYIQDNTYQVVSTLALYAKAFQMQQHLLLSLLLPAAAAAPPPPREAKPRLLEAACCQLEGKGSYSIYQAPRSVVVVALNWLLHRGQLHNLYAMQSQINTRMLICSFFPQLTAHLNLCPIYLKLLVHVHLLYCTCTWSLRQIGQRLRGLLVVDKSCTSTFLN